MSNLANFTLLARYNQWMNQRIYAAAESLGEVELAQDRGAFFGSVLGTLNHILVGDTVWLNRFARHPAEFDSLAIMAELPNPDSLDQILYPDFKVLRSKRVDLDQVIVNLIEELTDQALNVTLGFNDMRGQPMQKSFTALLQHFFNHQTHHRGQVTTLLSQRGIDPGVTDLLELIPNQDH